MHALTTLSALAVAMTAVDAHTIHSALVFTRHGDRTAKYFKGYEMTKLGAQQVYSSGQFYRNRYLTGSHPIKGLSRDQAVTQQIWASAPDQHVLYQTATNFLQGLYPPLDTASETLNNGTTISSPLDGYQFILVHGEDAKSPDTIWIKGDDQCPAYDSASKAYRQSAEYQQTLEASATFYSKFKDTLGPVMGDDNVSYANAYDVFDLINVASIHNRTIVNAPFDYEAFSVGESDLNQLRYYANEWEWNHNYNASESDRSIGGMSLAGGILQQLQSVVKGQAKTKFSLMAGSYDTFLAFFGLTNLHTTNADFMGLPNYASSMAIELFTDGESFSEDDLKVRFLFRNGTDEDKRLTPWPLFGRREVDLPWAAFVEELSNRSINTVEQWCSTCASTESFCRAINQASSSSVAGSLSTAAAGGIGAAVALAVVALIGAALWIARRRRQTSVERSGALVDAEKSLSDTDSHKT